MATKSAVPKVALAAVFGFAALALEILRRHKRGAIRKTPPLPEEIPHSVNFGRGHISDPSVSEEDLIEPAISRQDNYYWIRDDSRKSKKVLDHLRAENAYTNFKTLPLRPHSKSVYKELLSHYKETDQTVPAPRGKFVYYTRTVAGKSYKYHCRRQLLPDGSMSEEDIILDVNTLAAGMKYCDVDSVSVSPDDRYVGYSVDPSGYETYEVRFVDLESKSRKVMKDHTLRDTTGKFVWGTDSTRIFYHTMDEAHRANKLWTRSMNLSDTSSKAVDMCLFTEDDTEFLTHLHKTTSGRFIFLGSFASMTTEYRFIDLHAEPSTPSDDNANTASSDGTVIAGGLTLKVVKQRKPGVMYAATHARGDEIFIVTNEGGATNFKLMKTTVQKPSEWKEAIPYDETCKFDDIECFGNFAAISGRQGGYMQIWIMPMYDPSKMYTVPVDDIAHEISMYKNLEYETSVLRYTYSSLTTPEQTFEINYETKNRVLLKQLEVPGYDSKLYATERLDAVSEDGTSVPISLVYRRAETLPDVEAGKERAMLLYGYGSYEVSIDPSFSMTRLPLLDRGVVYAIAHIRGGGEYGRGWYEAARLHTKKKTFEDFVACAQHVVDVGRTSTDKLAIEGWSAGGLLMGAVMNMRPDLFRAAVVGVPFVDTLTTMSDVSLPLTTGEWQEWGNPHTKEFFDVIRDYCPYSNIKEAQYPSMLVLSGLNDPRVHYCEPTKYVAKVRKHVLAHSAAQKDDRTTPEEGECDNERDILLKIDLSSGHFSASNRYHYMEEKAFHMAWVLSELGLIKN